MPHLPLLTLIKRDLTLSISHSSGLFTPLLFFIITASLFPFVMGPDSHLLSTFGTGILWVAVLLAGMLPLPFLLEEDFQDGSLEQVILSNIWPPVIILAKWLVLWLTTALPLILLTPLLGLMLDISSHKIGTMMLSLLLGTPTLSMIGLTMAALTLGSRKGSSLIALITLPFTIPVLIFGAISSAAEEALLHQTSSLLLAAFLLILAPLCFFAASLAIASAVRYR